MKGIISGAVSGGAAVSPTTRYIPGPQGERGPQGPKGDKGDAFTYSDFTAEQLEALRGPKGDTGPQGPKGDKGDAFTYSDFTSEQLAALTGPKGDKGDTGAQGPAGPQGPQGDTGPAGSDASVTEEAIEAALGYTPMDPASAVAKQQGAENSGKLLGIGADGNVEPTEREIFICTVTGNQSAGYACDKTTVEIAQARNAGRLVYATDGTMFYPATVTSPGMARFEILNGVNNVGFMLLANGTMSKFQNQIQIASGKVTAISAASTDAQYPSAKCVYDALAEKQSKPETYEAVFNPADWFPNNFGYYEQSVTVEGLKRDYITPPDIDVKLSGTNASEDAQLLADWALVSLAQVDNDTLVLQCAGDPPASIELPVIIRVWQ